MDDADAAAIAETMGFSSFGAQNPHKRRRYNPAADAVVDSSAVSTVPLHQGRPGQGASSGANSQPLGTRAKNEAEINLDEDEEEEDDGIAPPAAGPNTTHHVDGDDDPEPQYLDTSRPSDAEVNAEVQSNIDAIVGQSSGSSQLPPKPSFAPGGRGGRGNRDSGRGQSSHQTGKKWWEDYYDPSSNVNPWERLEENRGLKPRGNWMTWEEAKG